MILHFQISEGDSILVAAIQIAAIREIDSDESILSRLIIYLVGGQQIRVPDNDYNRAAGALWKKYIDWDIEGGEA